MSFIPKTVFSNTKQKNLLAVYVVYQCTLPPTASRDTPEHRQTNVDTDYDLTGPEQEGCVRGCAVFFPLIIVCTDVVKVYTSNPALGYADCVLVNNAHIWQGLLSSRTSCCEFI